MKKIIIVCEDKYRAYGDYLAQLISLDDDTEDDTVGIKDGEVAAQVWLEKDYNSNSAQISSNQYILFIGNDKLIKEKSSHMEVKFSQYGMVFAWLGKQAALTIDEIVSYEKYNDFLNYAKNYQKNLEQLIEEKKEKIIVDENNREKTKKPFSIVLSEVLAPIGELNLYKKILLNKKIKAQQYSCAIMKFYLDFLSDFLKM